MGFLSSLRRDIQGGTDSYKDFIDQRNDWVEPQLPPSVISYEGSAMDGQRTVYKYTPEMQKQLDAAGPASYEGYDGGQVINPTYQTLERQFNQQLEQQEMQRSQLERQLQESWITTLPPETQQQVAHEFQQHSADGDMIGKYGKMAAIGIIGAAAGGAGLAALGGSGAGTALSGVDAAMADVAASGSLQASNFAAGLSAATPEVAEMMALGYTEQQAIASVAQEMAASGATQSVAVTAPAITGATSGAGTGLVGAAAGTGAALTSGANMPTDATSAQNQEMQDLFKQNPDPSYWDKLMNYAGNMSADQWVKAGLGTLSMYNAVKGMSGGPEVPDYQKLNQENLLASRPNQENAYGDTSTWTQNPDGTWAQKTSFGATNQGLYDTASSLKGGLLEQAKNSAPLTTAGLPDLGSKVMDPVGNNDAITQAWLARMRPELDRGREAEMQRLANMGVTENRYGGENQAFGNAMDVLNRKDVDATNQALIYGTDAYNKSFQNSIAADQSDRQNYQTEFNANKDVANNPYYQLNQVQGVIPGTPSFQQAGGNPNAMQAGTSEYQAQLDANNAKMAQLEKNTAGLWDLYKTFKG